MKKNPKHIVDRKTFSDLVDMHLDYRRYNPGRTPGYLTKAEYNKLIQGINERIKDYLIYDEGEVVLPEKMGTLCIVGHKTKVLDANGNIRKHAKKDMNKTWQLWKAHPELRFKQYVYFTNDHTNGMYYKAEWNKRGIGLKHTFPYKFTLLKPAKRELYERLINPDVTPGYFISNN